MQLTPLQGDFGAAIRGVDLRQPLSAAESDEILAALDRHVVLAFPGQQITDEQQLAVARLIGTPTSYHQGGDPKRLFNYISPQLASVTNLDENGNPRPVKDLRYEGLYNTRLWHSDHSWKQTPDRATLLAAKEIPPVGGNTEFIDMRAAWDAIPARRQRELERLLAFHSREHGRLQIGVKISEEDKRRFPPALQPLVRTNARTGRKALYLGVHSSHAVGMPEQEGRALVKELFAHIAQPQFVYSYRWHVDDLVVWDNAQTTHRSTPFEEDKQRRLLRRVGVLENGPVVDVQAASRLGYEIAA